MRAMNWQHMQQLLPWFTASIRTLDFGMCHYRTCNMRSDVFARCTQLRHLNLDGGKPDLTALQTLVLRCPLLETISVRDVAELDEVIAVLHPLKYLRSISAYVAVKPSFTRRPVELEQYLKKIVAAYPPQVRVPEAIQELLDTGHDDAIYNSIPFAEPP
eukprot:TRINITY_DN3057_c0_g1_i3.p2 TRINITY_DN3057_c0_g1~~TRINITY_DN3057_c0_g1_i3.p2  ORF type:complete len:159 (+),score=28.26 TRINITY_DN3057_c0_g1_i3:588-1064(+)